MDDTVSRQAVIKVLDEIEAQYVFEDGHDRLLQYAKNKVAGLPSAQPEIIHCKDCKHWMSAYLAISGKHGCNKMRDYTAPDDYCCNAERKED